MTEKAPYRPVVPESLDDINLLDVDLQHCPYHAYRKLRDEAPVWRDPLTGFYVITRFEDLHRVLLDTERFVSSMRGGQSGGRNRIDPQRAERVLKLYEDKGWVPAQTLAARDDPNHRQMRAIFNEAFRPRKINEMDPFVRETAARLIDAFIDAGRCDWVKQFAIPLPLIIIGRQMGVPEADIWKIKAWTDAWVQRLGMMQTEAEEHWSVEMEIEAQHYFQPIFERLRKEPDDTLLSELVNRVIPEWGRPLNDNELHAEMMADTFVGGAETSTNAIWLWREAAHRQPAGLAAAQGRAGRLPAHLCRGGAAPGKPGAGTVPGGRHRHRAARRHYPQGGADQPALRRRQPRRAGSSPAPRRWTWSATSPAGIWPLAPASITAWVRRWPGASCTGRSRRCWSGLTRCGLRRAGMTSASPPTSLCGRSRSCTSSSGRSPEGDGERWQHTARKSVCPHLLF